MAKILNSTVLNGNVSKMVELFDQVIVNGSTYDKITLSPNALDFCPIYVSSNNEILLYQTAYVPSYWYRNKSTNGFLVDNNDPSIYYVATHATLGGSASLHRLVRSANGLVDTTNTDWGGSYGEFLDLIGQDQQKVYYTINRSYSGAFSYIGSFDKITMTQKNLNLNTGTIKILKETDMFFYIATPSVNATTMNIGKYNKINNSITWLLIDTQTAGYYSDTYVSDMDNSGTFYCMKDGIGLGMTDHFVAYKKYILDTNKDIVTTGLVTVDMSLFPNNKIYINSSSTMAVEHTLFNYTDTVTGKKYINHLVYNKGTRTISLNQSDSALYTYEIVDSSNWKLVSYTQFAPIIYKAFLPIFNNQILMLAYENGVHFYNWDVGTTSYQKVSSYDAPILAMGIDMNNNIYIQYTDSSIESVSNVMPSIIYADFEQTNYNYNGEDLQGNIIVYVKNFLGQHLATTLQLTLYGNVKFTENALKTKTVTTSNLDRILVPVTIMDSGILKVTAKLK